MWLSVVILNYNSEAFLERCLRSIRQCCAHHTPEILVIDNGSHQVRAVRRICSGFGVDRVVENRTNMGVAAARNQGVRMSSGDLVCTLDVDTILTPGALEELASVARDATVGVCGPQLRFPDGRLQHTCRLFPTIYTKLLRLRPGYDFFGALEVEEMRAADHSAGMQVDWVIGACQVYSRRVFDELGGYTVFSRFGFEDVDLCLRSWLSGKRVRYVPSAIVFHDEQRVARGRNRALTASHLVSLIRYFGTHGYGFGRERLYRRIAERNPYFTRTMGACPIAADWERDLVALESAIMGQSDEAGQPNPERDAAGPGAGHAGESMRSRAISRT
jgi:hypothetical protein